MPGRPSLRYLLLLTSASVWLALVFAPAFLAESSPVAAGAISLSFSRVCHQLADRSLHVAGYPVAVVNRVTRIPQEPFADVSATPAAALDHVREIMLIWSAPTVTEEAPDE